LLLRHEGVAKSTQTLSQKLVFAHLVTNMCLLKSVQAFQTSVRATCVLIIFCFFIYIIYLLKYQITFGQLDYKKNIKNKNKKPHLTAVKEIVILKEIKLFFSILIKKR
jgi:uncharacterized protein (DUF488 family)